jgi:hypothetical protein
MRSWFGGVFLGIVFALSCGTAGAAGPVRSAVEPFPRVTFQAGEYCSFPVREEVVVTKQTAKDFFDNDGNITREIVTGRYVIRYTNLATGKRITLNASGPGTFSSLPDGAVRFLAPGITVDVPH